MPFSSLSGVSRFALPYPSGRLIHIRTYASALALFPLSRFFTCITKLLKRQESVIFNHDQKFKGHTQKSDASRMEGGGRDHQGHLAWNVRLRLLFSHLETGLMLTPFSAIRRMSTLRGEISPKSFVSPRNPWQTWSGKASKKHQISTKLSSP